MAVIPITVIRTDKPDVAAEIFAVNIDVANGAAHFKVRKATVDELTGRAPSFAYSIGVKDLTASTRTALVNALRAACLEAIALPPVVISPASPPPAP